MSDNIQNTVYFQTALLTNPTSGTVLYDAGVTGQTGGKGLINVFITASAPCQFTYTTLFNKTVTNQTFTLTSDLVLQDTIIKKIELAAGLTGTIQLLADELM